MLIIEPASSVKKNPFRHSLIVLSVSGSMAGRSPVVEPLVFLRISSRLRVKSGLVVIDCCWKIILFLLRLESVSPVKSSLCIFL